jgi:hypothetical protein
LVLALIISLKSSNKNTTNQTKAKLIKTSETPNHYEPEILYWKTVGEITPTIHNI